MDDCDWNISGNWWRCGMAGDQRRARRVQAMTEQDVDKHEVAMRNMDYNIFLIYNYNFIQKKITIYVGSNDTMLRQSEVTKIYIKFARIRARDIFSCMFLNFHLQNQKPM